MVVVTIISMPVHTHNLILPKIFTGKDDSMSYVIDALANIIDELKRDGKER
jgi:hypothetical protein